MRILPRHVVYEQRLADLAKVVHIIETVGGAGTNNSVRAGTQRYRNTAADARVLRMIPVVAEGVGGRVPGTNPLDELIAAESRNSRHSVRRQD